MKTKIKMITILVLVLLTLMLIFGFIYIKNKKKDATSQLKEEKTIIAEQEKSDILKNNESFNELIEKYAVDTQSLTIGQNCQMDPLVIRFKGDSNLVIENKDSQMHTIAFENQNFFTVSPNDKREININKTFNLTEGKLFYKCTDLSQENNVGVMYIITQ